MRWDAWTTYRGTWRRYEMRVQVHNGRWAYLVELPPTKKIARRRVAEADGFPSAEGAMAGAQLAARIDWSRKK